MKRETRMSITIVLIISISTISIGPFFSKAVQEVDSQLMTGPFLDKVTFNIITQDDQQVLALQDNEIDLIGNTVDPSFFEILQEAQNIAVDDTLRNGYGYFTLNTQKFPFNYTALRRAIAFALDKEYISDEIWDGLSIPQDSPVPQSNPISIEGALDYTYYESDTERANALLDAAGFAINETTGYREAPNGEAFNITIEWPDSSSIAIEVTENLIEAIESLSIYTDVHHPTCWHCSGIWNSLYNHGDYDIIFLGTSFPSFDVDWLGYEFHSDYSTIPFYNFPNFCNATYDL
ncbi:MAG: ABC transporter substrate-binding protein, partial [Candidatus Thorarchaeota archaeon]